VHRLSYIVAGWLDLKVYVLLLVFSATYICLNFFLAFIVFDFPQITKMEEPLN
jgi:hypothetical protein